MSAAAAAPIPAQQPPPAAAAKPGGGGIDVPRPGGVCAASGEPILPGDKFVAAIRETPTGIERRDVRVEHWPTFDRTGLLAFWHTVMPPVEQRKKLFVDDEVLCTLFERLADATEEAKLNFRFVLALVLMRKRLIVYEETRREEGHDVWVVRLKGREDRLDLVDPKLDESKVSDVSQQLGEILNEAM
jgi:hypothetical protein